VEEIMIARETEEISPTLYQEILTKLAEVEWVEAIKLKIVTISQEAFKKATGDTKAVIRTGKFTPYASLILKSGVVF
jgi:D-ribose pyranase